MIDKKEYKERGIFMKYMSAKTAASKWKLTQRTVQNYCRRGLIDGCLKFERSWMIPENARCPGRQEDKDDDAAAWEFENRITNAFRFSIQNMSKVVDNVPEADTQIFIRGMTAFFKGDFHSTLACCEQLKRNKRFFCGVKYAKAMSAIAAGKYLVYQDCLCEMESVESHVNIRTAKEVIQIAVLLTMFDTEGLPSWFREGDFRSVPHEMRNTCFQQYIRYLSLTEQNAKADGIAMVWISMKDNADTCFTMDDIYLRLYLAVGCYRRNDLKKAEEWAAEALSYGIPSGILKPYAELSPQLGGIMEKCIKAAAPQMLKPFSRLCTEMKEGWKKFFKEFYRTEETQTLTFDEFYAARLLQKGMSYKEIAAQMNLSQNKVSKMIAAIYEKQGVHKKSELSLLPAEKKNKK